jgi:hypothetical protein
MITNVMSYKALYTMSGHIDLTSDAGYFAGAIITLFIFLYLLYTLIKAEEF